MNCLHDFLTTILKEWERNNLPKFCEAIFSSYKAKNTDIPESYQKVFPTKYEGK